MNCPAKGCTQKIRIDQVACRGHWFSLPQILRNRIWRLFDREQGSDAHRAAVFEAVTILTEGKKA